MVSRETGGKIATFRMSVLLAARAARGQGLSVRRLVWLLVAFWTENDPAVAEQIELELLRWFGFHPVQAVDSSPVQRAPQQRAATSSWRWRLLGWLILAWFVYCVADLAWFMATNSFR